MKLPTEVYVQILGYCDLATIRRVLVADRRMWSIAVYHDSIWEAVGRRTFPDFVFTPAEQQAFGKSTGLAFFKFLYTTLRSKINPLILEEYDVFCRNLVVVPYGLLMKAFKFPTIANLGILVYLRYQQVFSSISLQEVLDRLIPVPDLCIRCTFLGAIHPDLTVYPGKLLADIKGTFPDFITPLAITEKGDLTIFTLQKSTRGLSIYYSTMNSNLKIMMTLFTQLNSHYEFMTGIESR